jgi:signal recognition particle receptor subunit beta
MFCRDATLLLFANKQDLAGALNASELRERMDLDRICSNRSWYVQPCCALTGDGLLHGFEWLAAELKKVKK